MNLFRKQYNKKDTELVADDAYYELKASAGRKKRDWYSEFCEKREKEFYLDCVRIKNNPKKHYNSLVDPFLVDYFNKPNIKKQMVRKGLLQTDGKINMDKDVTNRKVNLKVEELKVIENENEMWLDIKEKNKMLVRKLNKIANEDISNLKEKNYREVSKISHIHNFKPRMKRIAPIVLPPIDKKVKSVSQRKIGMNSKVFKK